MKVWVGFGPADAACLRAAAGVAGEAIPRVADVFYRSLLQDPQASALVQDAAQVQRLHRSLCTWMSGLFSGSYGPDYFEDRCAIGRTHVRVNLPQRFMFTGMSVVRRELDETLTRHAASDASEVCRALHKLLDLELALMLETNREHYVAKVREADRRIMQRRIDEVQHMASLGQLAASLAHEIKNPLAGISGAIQIISKDLTAAHPHFEIMREILRQIDRLDSAVKDLLIYARPKAPELDCSDVGETITNCLTLLSEDPQIKSLRIECHGMDRPVLTRLDRAQFAQVISNLLLNAAQACEGRGRVDISVSRQDGQVCVIVADDGPGMPEKVKARAQEPFFTTKTRGSGLGLPICRRIIEAHQGQLTIDSDPGRGTQVLIRLPDSIPETEESPA